MSVCIDTNGNLVLTVIEYIYHNAGGHILDRMVSRG
jgi:hypothetical protein